MQNHFKRTDYSLDVRDNLSPIELVWDDVIADAVVGEMPVLRKNYKEMQVEFTVYLDEMDRQDLLERATEWQNLFTSMSTT